MEKVLPHVVAMAAIAAGVLVGLSVFVLFVAGMANGSPQHLRFMTRMLWLIGLGTGAAAVAAVTLMIYGRPWPASIVGGAPAVVWIVMVIVMAQLGI